MAGHLCAGTQQHSALLHLTNIALRILLCRHLCAQVLELNWCSGVGDTGLAAVARLPRLTHLRVRFCNRITDLGLVHLLRMRSLKLLDAFESTGVTPLGLADVAHLLPP